MGLLIIGKWINAHMFFKRLELKEKIWCDIVAQAKVVRANYGHQLMFRQTQHSWDLGKHKERDEKRGPPKLSDSNMAE